MGGEERRVCTSSTQSHLQKACCDPGVYDSRGKQQIAGNCDDELTTTTVRSSQEILLFGFILLKTIDFYPVRKKMLTPLTECFFINITPTSLITTADG